MQNKYNNNDVHNYGNTRVPPGMTNTGNVDPRYVGYNHSAGGAANYKRTTIHERSHMNDIYTNNMGGISNPGMMNARNSGVNTSFNAHDLNDFPSLGAMRNASSTNNASYGTAVSGRGRDTKKFEMAAEDFPALPGAIPKPRQQAHHQPPVTKQVHQSKSTSIVNGDTGTMHEKAGNPYSLLYFVHTLKNNHGLKDTMLRTLAIGTDLSTVGLDLSSQSKLSDKFSTPWNMGRQRYQTKMQKPLLKEVPQCYRKTPMPETLDLHQLHEETLLYMFYSKPRDETQMQAAIELYKRDWKYHKEYQIWIQNLPPRDPRDNHHSPDFKTVFFDCTAWEKRCFQDTVTLSSLEPGIMQPAELRKYLN